MGKYQFCPHCRNLIIIKEVGRGGKKREACSRCQEIFYHNSIPCVGAVIVDNNKVLLGKRKYEPSKGYWDILGGFLELGEHPADGLIREIKEETGLKVKPIEILGIFMDKYGSKGEDTLNIHYLAQIISGKACASDDVEELRWFSKRNLPKKIAFRNSRQVLKVWRKM